MSTKQKLFSNGPIKYVFENFSNIMKPDVDHLSRKHLRAAVDSFEHGRTRESVSNIGRALGAYYGEGMSSGTGKLHNKVTRAMRAADRGKTEAQRKRNMARVKSTDQYKEWEKLQNEGVIGKELQNMWIRRGIRAGVTMSGLNVAGRVMGGGIPGLVKDNYGDFDIAGVPFI